MKKIVCTLVLFAGLTGVCLAAAPKRLLVVTTSTGFRHTSIEVTEKVLHELAQKSGEFTIISTMDHPDYPDYTTSGAFGRQVTDGTPAQITFIRKMNDRVNSPLLSLQAKVTEASNALVAASLGGNAAAIAARAKDLGAAELALATAKANAFGTLQGNAGTRLTAQQIEVFKGNGQSPAAPRTTFAPQVGAATPAQQKAIAEANASPAMVELAAAVTKARTELAAAALTAGRDANALKAKSDALAAADTALAVARANEFARIQTVAGKFSPAVTKTLVSRFSVPETGNATTDGAAKVLADMLSVEALKNYDGVFFASTTGILPFPDLDGLIGWVRNGGAWLGNHAASDSMHGVPKYYEMMGGEFAGHGSQTRETMTVVDPKNPIGAAIGKTLTVHDEMYMFENENFDYSRVHAILDFTQSPNDGLHSHVGAPGHWPSIWIKEFGKGRVFFSALGHREDVIDPTWGTPATRMNPPEVAQAYQRMLLEGVRYGLGITKLDATPQAKVPTRAGSPEGRTYRNSRGNGGTNPPLYMDEAP